MEPLAAAAYVWIASMAVIAIFWGAIGGVLTATLKFDLAWGALIAAGTYLVALPFLGPWKASLIGLFPLVLTFLVASLTTRRLRYRMGFHPALAIPAGLVCALGTAFVYSRLTRFGSWGVLDPRTNWIALGAILCLIILSIRKRSRVDRS